MMTVLDAATWRRRLPDVPCMLLLLLLLGADFDIGILCARLSDSRPVHPGLSRPVCTPAVEPQISCQFQQQL